MKPIQQLTLPVTVSITQRRAEETVNLVDAEDAVKYLPSVFLRKRNNGDTQATLATRVWGTSSSARSLIFADGVPLTALIANNNTVGGPRWGLVAPPEVERIDMMMGPYSAAYAGNSMGAVMEITTRLPREARGPDPADAGAAELRPVRHAQELHDVADRRERRRPVRQVRLLGERQLPEEQQPAAELRDERVVPDRYDGRLSRSRTSSTPRRTCSARAACCTRT